MPMIDKERLKEAMCVACGNGVIDGYACNGENCTMLNVIDEQPTIEAEPVRHARWIEIERYEYYGTDFAPHSDYKCSECSYVTTKPTGLMPMFCEDCGAKMNGDAQTIVR